MIRSSQRLPAFPKPVKKKFVHIGLLVDASRAYGRGICRGVADFAEAQKNWLIIPHERPEISKLTKTGVDGIIAYIPDEKLLNKVVSIGVPTINVHGYAGTGRVTTIGSEHPAIVRLALDFLQRAGFRHLAYCGYPGVYFSDEREKAFLNMAPETTAGHHVYSPHTQRHATENYYTYEKSSTDGTEGLSSWLKELPKPVGLIACNDIRGQQVINACRESGIRVPEEVAVIGVDNDEIICRLSFPTLSSIQPDVDKIGHLAAELLSRQLKGEKTALTYRVPPLRIVERQSTDTLVANDPTVVEVAHMLRKHISQGGDVPRICKSMGLSRQNLDKLFVKNLGRTVSGEVTRIRLQVIKSLLLNSDFTLKVIANRSGFSSVTYLCRFFKRQTGKTPEEFRDL